MNKCILKVKEEEHSYDYDLIMHIMLLRAVFIFWVNPNQH